MTGRARRTYAVLCSLVVLMGCRELFAIAATGSENRLNQSGTPKVGTMTTIEIDGGANRWIAQIEDNPSARDFLVQLPLELKLDDYAGTEKVASLPRKLTRDAAPVAVMPRAGDFAYYAPWGNLALFYRDGHHSPGLIILGRFLGPVAGLATPGSISVTIRRSGADRRDLKPTG